jgi:hypothetical protein
MATALKKKRKKHEMSMAGFGYGARELSRTPWRKCIFGRQGLQLQRLQSEVVESAGDASTVDNGNKTAVPVGGSGKTM